MESHGIVGRPAAFAAAIAVGAVTLAGCGANSLPNTQVLAAAGTAPAPMTVTCEPTQRAIVRQVVINGTIAPQVQCASAADIYEPAAAPAPVPVNYEVSARYQNAAYVAEPPARVQSVSRRRAPTHVVRNERPWQKSALIIGSSAGIGAGVGAAVGGKKGALIGAALGGGGATIWDQLTRRR